MADLHSLPAGTWPDKAIRNNGPDSLALERYKIRELAEGWPCYRYHLPFSSCPDNNIDPAIIANGKISNLFSIPMHSCTQHGPEKPQSQIS
jgi:hypothetical protein